MGQSGAQYFLSRFTHVHRTHTQTLPIPQHHTDDKDLSQHPQITLHAMYSIRGFLERLSTEPDYTPAPKGSTGCYF